MFPTLLEGFGLGASLIIAIGAQNAFVLRQGLRRQYVLPVAALCTGIDWTLILLGAAGFGALISASPALTSLAAWGGAIFLGVYGTLAFRSALFPHALKVEDAAEPAASLRAVLGFTLAVSLLNPHVYLDTVVLLGSIAGQHPPDQRAIFALGAGLASLTWFFSLGYGARLLAPLFRRPAAWRALDLFIGVVMWSIALSLVLGELGK